MSTRYAFTCILYFTLFYFILYNYEIFLHLKSHSLTLCNRNLDLLWLLMLHGADASVSDLNWNGKSQTVWEQFGDVLAVEAFRSALLHFWSPKDHYRFPDEVKDGIKW